MSENLIRYTTCKLIDNNYYNQWVSENTDISKNTASLLPTSNQNGKRIYVYSNDTKIMDIYLITSNIDNTVLEDFDEGAFFINNDENIYQVSVCYTDEDNINDFVLDDYDDDLSITLANFTTATENTIYNIDEYSWKYENVKVPEYDVTLYLLEKEIVLREYLFNSTFITNIELQTNLITAISNHCFSLSLALNNIKLPNSITSLGVDSFTACKSLTSITIPDSVTSIGNNVFSECSGLTSVTIPSSVTSIGSYAFSMCYKLTSVICKAITPPTLGSYNFTAVNDTLYVPAESVEAYKASNWNDYFSSIEAIPEPIPEPVYGFNLDGMIDTDYMKEF